MFAIRKVIAEICSTITAITRKYTAEPSWGAAPCAAHSRFGGRTYDVAAETVVIKGESHTKSNLTKIGGGTAA